ncbi:hypothetical protein [Acidovorax sp. 56]|uniref:hypothetical protein n=1 Tax=Acidovorax sp. 56 TaxID=2035205 RepID=UPI00117776E7|nr:hypothetical protein [Acidovorax sp. 56]
MPVPASQREEFFVSVFCEAEFGQNLTIKRSNKVVQYEVQGEWLESLPCNHQVLFLTALSHCLTVAGRDSYTPQSEELEHPTHLRRINEIQHRVAACAYELLVNDSTESFRRSIAHWVLDQADQRMSENMQWAWRTAKERVLKTVAQRAVPQ